MDRFFSKLDLRDIKIDPFNTSFPPEEDEAETAKGAVEAEAIAEPEPVALDAQPSDRAAVGDEPAPDWAPSGRQPHLPAWAGGDAASVPPMSNGHANLGGPEALNADSALANGLQMEQSGEVLKVSARSRPSAVAGAIAGVVREAGRAEVQAIGAGATNQAVKAVAIARDYLRETGIEAICLPAFIDVTIENEDRTAIRLVVEPR